MEDQAWNDGSKAIGMYLNGDGIPSVDETGQPIRDAHFLLYFNGGHEDVEVVIPSEEYAAAWDEVIDTAGAALADKPHEPGARVQLPARSLLVLQQHVPEEEEPDSSVAASLAARRPDNAG
jgi:glycogen operon protein